jgi:uncharacterized protein (DUF1786 family)
MKILAIDVGTGTQDILLFDTEREPENSLKLVLPAPTAIIADQIQRATQAGQRVLLTGVTMGGGPSTWAVERRQEQGLTTFATPDAARTFNDNLEEVCRDLNVTLVSDDEAAHLATESDVAHIGMRDLMLPEIERALAAFGVTLDVDVLAVAVFDHGNAPPNESDRAFRFAYLRQRIEQGQGLSGFAFPRHAVPPILTRLQAVAHTAPDGWPLVLMDTAPAAVLGALDDPIVAQHPHRVVANVGNFHTLAFLLDEERIVGLFEHHTGLLDRATFEDYLVRLAQGTLTNEELFNHHGHGAIVFHPLPDAIHHLAVTGPRRSLLRGSPLHPYFAVPHGDMMQAGCFGLVRAVAAHYPEHASLILSALIL